MASTWIQVGFSLRKSVRFELARGGYRFTETKSLTESLFVITGTPAQINKVENWVRSWI